MDSEMFRQIRLLNRPNEDFGPRARAYFRLLSGRDAADDGPEVDIIRRARHIPEGFTFKTIGGITFCIRENKPKSLGYDCDAPLVRTLLGGK
jgi:hypothetical protein